MKRERLLALACAGTLALSLLSACGGTASAPAGTTSPSPSPSESMAVEETVNTYNGPSFGAKRASLADTLSTYFSATEYPNAFDTDPTPEEMDDGALAYDYNIADGASCILYGLKDSDELIQVLLYGDSSKMDTAAAEAFGAYASILTAAFSDDKNDLASIDEKLDIVNAGFAEGTLNSYTGGLASFSYMVDDDVAFLTIIPAY